MSNIQSFQTKQQLLYAASVDLVLAGHVHITIGDGGNREGLAHRYINPRPKWSEFRETIFGHGELKIVTLLMPSGVGIGMIMMSPYNY
ncbi:iron/zinc purple acid phosphatase-like protein C [Medicago truncatula]|uniref:Iron/zinc purple acid phosphatase-like protein C n=1 Tax=Medicago truncatula TaxID=3880 RepID=G7K8H4_MEDTR|nr:iron/zinc purple acid phosphatase-like protein C [Medicago truncatula]